MQILIKDQIRNRREALGVSLRELADRVGVSEQAIRHWESGTSYPAKKRMHLVEQALTFKLDWTEGDNSTDQFKTQIAMVDKGDVELVLMLGQLPARMKGLIQDIAREHLEVVQRARSLESSPTPPAKKSLGRVKTVV